MAEATAETPFRRWYKKHRKELAVKRKAKYQSDPAYREKAKLNAAAQRAKLREQDGTRLAAYTLTNAAVADAAGVSALTLRLWRDRGYYPAPYEFRGRIYFTKEQGALLEGLGKFFREKGRRLAVADLTTLDNLVNYIAANWR